MADSCPETNSKILVSCDSLFVFVFLLLFLTEVQLITELLLSVVKQSEVKSLSWVQLFATPWTVVACQVPLSMGFSRQEYWSGLPFPSVVYTFCF